MSRKNKNKKANEETPQQEEAQNVETPEVETVEQTTEQTAEKETVEDEVAKLKAELEAEKKNYLRLAAEYDNYRKRTTKEKENIYTDARVDTIKPFLEVYDNLIRGLAQCEDGDSHKQGLEMIAKQFLTVLEKLGVKEIEAEGQPFDPEKHNAVMHVEDENYGENTVVEVFQKGFALNEKVIRFAMVKVAN